MFKGFFNRMYNGNPNKPDIDPEDMPRNKFELFFATLGMRIGDLVKLNLLFVVSILPVLLVGASYFLLLFSEIQKTPVDSAMIYSINFWHLVFLIPVLALAGPPLAGLTYITRNYARDEHVWLWSDYREQMKQNWKQSMGLMALLGVVFFIAFLAIRIYSSVQQMPGQSWIWIIELIFIIFVGIFIVSYMYAFPLLVTYKLKMSQILKNSLMLALGRLPFTVMFAFMLIFPVLLGLIVAASITAYALLVLLLYYGLLGFSFSAFIITSYTNATFTKLLKTEDDTPKDDNNREVMP